MEISFDQKLLDYMARKGYAALRIETIDPVGCCADSTELCIGFVRTKDMPAITKKALRVLECPQGMILILSRGIEIEETVQLGLRSFLGVKDVTADGIHAWKL